MLDVDSRASAEALEAPGSILMLDPMAALEAASETIRAPGQTVALEAHGSPFDFFEAFQRARPAQPPTRRGSRGARAPLAARSATSPATSVSDPSIGRPSEEDSKQSSQLTSHRELYSREAGKVASFLAGEKTTSDDAKLQHAHQALPLVWGRRLLSNSLAGGLSVAHRKLPRSARQASTEWTVLDEECACPVCNQPFISIGARWSHLKAKNDAKHVAFRARDTSGTLKFDKATTIELELIPIGSCHIIGARARRPERIEHYRRWIRWQHSRLRLSHSPLAMRACSPLQHLLQLPSQPLACAGAEL